MYIVIQKGVRVWGVGITAQRAWLEAHDHGLPEEYVPGLRCCLCTPEVWRLFINNDLYPELVEKDLVERPDGMICVKGGGIG